MATQQPDLNPVDYKIWGVLQERVYKTSIKDVDELRCRIAEEWDKLDQLIIIDKAVGEWRKRLRACVAAGEDSLNTRCEHISFLIYCIGIFRPNSLKYCFYSSKNWLFCLVLCYMLCATFCNCNYILCYTKNIYKICNCKPHRLKANFLMNTVM